MRYTSLDSQTLTVGGGSGKLKIQGSSMQLSWGSKAHVDLNADYTAVCFGNYNVMVDSTGVHINGKNGAQNF